jgi:drug/metabolite transporter (DMT)-like permease
VLLGLGAALAAAVLYGVAAILQASGARKVESAEGLDPRVMVRILRQPAAASALGLILVGFLLHLLAVRLVPLFLAQAGIAASLVVTAVLAVLLFGDRLSRTEWVAVAAVFGGLVLLAISAGGVGDSRTGSTLPIVVFSSLVVIAGAAALAARWRSPLSTAALGLLAGFGYAIVGISARLLPDLASPLDLFASPMTYTLVLGGALAFFLYSLALQRGSVTLATTPMIVTQTVTPAAVGVLLLGDSVRPGWTLGAAVGFLVTVLAASVLVRFEGSAAPRSGTAREASRPTA